jgi:hypothetical protein
MNEEIITITGLAQRYAVQSQMPVELSLDIDKHGGLLYRVDYVENNEAVNFIGDAEDMQKHLEKLTNLSGKQEFQFFKHQYL